MQKPINFDTILKMREDELQAYLHKRMLGGGREVFATTGFLYSPGTVPILLVAHMDTVHRYLPTVCKSSDGEVIMAPEGIGGDDRAGIFAVMKTIEKHDCHVLFTHGEESGGTGARAFVQSKIRPDVNFIIEPDRQGGSDAVFYDCGNDDFIRFIEKTTGFKEQWGSFSDISIIAPALDRAAVNLSVGYYNQHTSHEYIRLSEVYKTIAAMDKIICSKGMNKIYQYKAVIYSYKKGTGQIYGGGYVTGYDWSEFDDHPIPPKLPSAYTIPLPAVTTPAITTPAPVLPIRKDTVPNPVYTGSVKYEDENPEEKDAKIEAWLADETAFYVESLIGYDAPQELINNICTYVYCALSDYGYFD